MLLKKLIEKYTWLSECILPNTCIMCSSRTKQAKNLCESCHISLPILPQHCQQCAQFIHGTAPIKICGSCQLHAPAFEHTLALFPYEPPIIQLITQLKFANRLTYAKALAECFIERMTNDWYLNQRLPDLIVPVPLHPQRIIQRGYNQAIEIARPIARHFSIPLDITGVIRQRATQAQSDLSARERQTNIKDAFFVKRDYSQKKLAVLDDVVTTGSTVQELCRQLKAHGAKEIIIWCCARRG